MVTTKEAVQFVRTGDREFDSWKVQVAGDPQRQVGVINYQGNLFMDQEHGPRVAFILDEDDVQTILQGMRAVAAGRDPNEG